MEERTVEPFLYNGYVCCWNCFIAFIDLGLPEIVDWKGEICIKEIGLDKTNLPS